MAKRTQYQIVGRYMDGKSVTGYHLQSLESGKAGKYTREQVCYLVGRGQVTNCDGQIYKDKVLLRGVGVELESLPVQQESGEIQRTGGVNNIRKKDTGADVMSKLFITQSITDGRSVVGYVVTNSGGGTTSLSRAQVLELARDGKLGNASFQTSNGKPILRGVGVNLNELPSIKVNTPNTSNTPNTPSEVANKVQPKVRGVGELLSNSNSVAKKTEFIDVGGYENVRSLFGKRISDIEGYESFRMTLASQLPKGIKLEKLFITKNEDCYDECDGENTKGYVDVNMLIREKNKGLGYQITTNSLSGMCFDIYCNIPGASYDNSESLQNIEYDFSRPLNLCKKVVKEIVNALSRA